MTLHPDDHILKSLQTGTLSQEEQLMILSHIADCEACAARLCNLTTLVLDTPPDFEEKVISKWHTQKKPHRLSLFLYSLRVGIAACIALMLLYSGVFERFHVDFRPLNTERTNSITTEMNRFTEKILNWEVSKNDQKTK